MFQCQWDKEVLVVSRICCRWSFSWRKPKYVSLTPFSSVGHLCDVVVANFVKWSWPTSLQKCNNWSRLTTRSAVCSWIVSDNLKIISNFYRKIIFNDEAHFWLNSFVNKQNMRYLSDSNPHILHESGVVYGPAAWLSRTSSVMIKTGTLLWMGIANVQW